LGKFEVASGGTLLLDEIGEMPMQMQAKLLRVLQEREIDKVGGDQPVEIDVRVIATTNRNLEKEVADGKFREDLFYRLNVFRVHLPPLRDRKDDISELVDYFVSKYNKENGFSVQGLSDEATKVLGGYEWPGNIRELENAIERAVVLTRTGSVHHSMFKFNSAGKNYSNELQAGMTVAEMEKHLILKTLDSCDGNRTKAADMLGISIRTLRNKLHEYGTFSGDPVDGNDDE
jgi:two-component system response regulator AtoC